LYYWLRTTRCYWAWLTEIETGTCYGMEMNVEKTKVMRISRQPFPLRIVIDPKQPNNMKYFNYLGSIINDATRTREIPSRIVMAKAAFNRKKNLFISKLDLHLRKNYLNSTFGAKLCVVPKLNTSKRRS
jgi:hypothetical protein